MALNRTKYNYFGKVALVTGSSSGIGAAIATQLAQYGARVTITGRNAEALEKVAQGIEQVSNGQQPLKLVGDLLDESFASKLITETVTKFGRLDILVNNAGHSTTGGSLASDNLLESFDRLIRLNVRSIVQLTQLAVPHLEATKGNIVNISSVVALKPYASVPLVYSTSKAALDMVTKCSALELGPKGIRVNSVNPGAVATAFGRSIGYEDLYKDMADMIKKSSVLGRLAVAEDIAPLVLFLASDDAVNITGSIMVNDTGVMLK